MAFVVAILVGAWMLGGRSSDRCEGVFDARCNAGAQAPAPDPGGREQPATTPGSLLPPRDEAERSKKPFGFNLGVWATGDDGPDRGVRALKLVGATHYRWSLSWNGTGDTTPEHPVSPEMRTPLGKAHGGVAFHDRVYESVVDAGITPVIVLLDVPRWASTLRECAKGLYAISHPRQCPPNWSGGLHNVDRPFYGQWRAFVAAIAKRYPKAVIEGPNEPDFAWERNQTNAASYTTAVPPERAAEIQCQLFQAVPQDRTVLSSSMSRAYYIQPFLERAKGCYDAFSFHPYPPDARLGAGSTFALLFAGLRSARSATGDSSPIWVTETGVTWVPDDASKPSRQLEEEFADRTRRLYDRLTTMPDVAAVMFHSLRDAPIDIHASPDSAEYHFGFFTRDWQPKLRACSFFVPGTPATGPCPAVPKASKSTKKKAAARCKRVKKRVRRKSDGKLVRRTVLVCPKATTKKAKAKPKRKTAAGRS
ncbi:glycosyl hydrolase [Conexibacter sp. SYSU D00693]|uniref:glycosyl hydrolase n=1 Tax=Conexibacter sp. SYSU D00693 TaxID=2812560 RepID=UPI00196BB185|nr:glycosyl hydrolase [Conexibacter sp. SYSU D00693]